MRARLLLAVTFALGASACAAGEEARVCSGVTLERPVLVLEVDVGYHASALGRIDESGCLEEVGDISLGGDPRLADADGRPLVLSRDTGEIHEIDREQLSIVRTVSAMPPGDLTSNPWDADFDGEGRLWVAGYDVGYVGLIAADGSWAGEVDLGEDDSDGLSPEASILEVVGDTVYVLLQRLDRNEVYRVDDATEPGRVVTFAVAPPHEARGSFELLARNPLSATRVAEGTLVVASPGNNHSVHASDGIEVVDLVERTSRLVLSEVAAGGSVLEAIIAGPNEGYALVMAASERDPTSVIAFDPEIGELRRVLASANSFVHSGLAVVGPHLIVGDRTNGAARLVFFDRVTGELVGSLEPQLMPPLASMALP